VGETASKGRDTFQKILALRTEVEQSILVLGKRTPNAKRLLNLLYSNPLVSSADIRKALDVSQPTGDKLIQDFEKLGILKEITGQSRWRMYAFERYLSLFIT
jgi:DNA-binding MarR family transcriptional regulator